MSNIITLNFEDCYCNLSTFYENVAKKLSIDIANDTLFDCRKICVNKSVQEAIWSYYREEKNAEDDSISTLWLICGPKANLDNKDNRYSVEVANGFITSR